MPPSLARRLAVSALALVCFALLAWALLGKRLSLSPEPGTVRTLDLSADVDALIDSNPVEAVSDAPVMRDGVAWPGLLITKEKKELLIETFANRHSGRIVSDPDAYFAVRPNYRCEWRFPEHPAKTWFSNSNSYGLRGRLEPASEPPDLRVIVTGDSHIEGVCLDHETYPVQLGIRLRREFPGKRIESFNAAVGGYDPYNYLGALEKFIALDPDVFVMTVFGGNDFKGAYGIRSYYASTKGEVSDNRIRMKLVESGIDMVGLNPQELTQAVFFLENPDEIENTIATMVALTERMRERCEEEGIELVCVYLPAPLRAQPQLYRELIATIEAALPEFEDPLSSSDRIADGWIEFVKERALRVLDLRPIFRAHEEQLYWRSDYHLNVRGQAVIAESLQPLISELLADR